MKNTTRRKQLKLDKKNRKKRQERRVAREPDLAYSGSKYRKDKYVPIYLATETAILEAFVISERRLTDHEVRAALTTLIKDLRRGTVPRLADLSVEEQDGFDAPDFLVWNILQHWKQLLDRSEPVGQDVLIGVLRTTLSSIDTWGSVSPTSRGYLNYIEGFLGTTGITVRAVTEDEFYLLDMDESV